MGERSRWRLIRRGPLLKEVTVVYSVLQSMYQKHIYVWYNVDKDRIIST